MVPDKEMHDRAWKVVSDFMETHLSMFAAKLSDAESTAMPASRSWIRNMVQEHGSAVNDHMVVLWVNCPALGVMGAQRISFLLSYISNVLSDYPDNAVCFLIHPNRAGHHEGRTLRLSSGS